MSPKRRLAWRAKFHGAVFVGLLGLAACAPEPAAAPGPEPAEESAPGFEEVARRSGIDFKMVFLATEQGENFKINLYDHGAGVSCADIDGDGFDDIYLLNQLGANGLYRNNGDGTFQNVTEMAGVALRDRICTSASFADIDNDGDQDLYVASTRGGNVLFVNDGKGVFTDGTRNAGLTLVAHTQGVAQFDYDGDGHLDLFVSNTARWTRATRDIADRYYLGPPTLFELVLSEPETNVLYRNRGDGTFEDVTEQTGLAGTGWGGDLAVLDHDLDGDLDLLVTNMFGISALYANEGGERFVDVTTEALGMTSMGTVGCKPLDVDTDGLLDLYLVDMHSDMWMPQDLDTARFEEGRKYSGPEGPMVQWGVMTAEEATQRRELLGMPEGALYGNSLFRNLGDGRFEEVSDLVGAETMWPWGIAAADFDLDGDEDAFLPSGMGFPYAPWRNALLMNEGGRFEDRGSEFGIEPRPGGEFLSLSFRGMPCTKSSRSAAVLDYDGDGRPDLVVNNFNEHAYLYRNGFAQRNWIGFRLEGTRSNRDAIGARVLIHTGDKVQVRMVCSAGGYLAQSTKTLYFGLGDAKAVDRVEIHWPSGAKQELTATEPGRVHDVVEPK